MTDLTNAFKEKLLASGAKLATNTINIYLVDEAEYTFSAGHTALADLPVAARVAGPVTLTGKSISNGAFDSDNFSFASVAGATAEAVVMHDATDDTFIGIFDGLTLTPNGNNIAGSVNAAGWWAF